MLKISNINIPGLQPVNLEVANTECIGLMGDSGCGKTRLLRAIADMDEFDGEVCIADLCRENMPASEWRRTVALLPAESQWWFDTVGEHFSSESVDWASLGFEKEVVSWQISHCSSGEKQRLGILRMLANQPKVLLLDEPTANLDSENTRKVEGLLLTYIQSHQAMAIWVSHNRAQLKRVSTALAYDLSEGSLRKINGSDNEMTP